MGERKGGTPTGRGARWGRAVLAACLALGLVPGAAAANFHPLDGPLNVDTTKQASGVRIGNSQGQPFVVWSENTGTGIPTQIHAKRFDGTDWVDVGGVLNVDSTHSASQPSLAFVLNRPYVAFQEINGSQTDPTYLLHVRSFDGTNWGTAGGVLNVSSTPVRDATEADIASMGNGVATTAFRPWVAWTEWNGVQGDFRIHVKEFDGNSTWTEKGTSPSTPLRQANAPSLAQTTSGISQFTPYLAWSELDANAGPPFVANVYVSRFNFGGAGFWEAPTQIVVNPGRSASGPALATVSNAIHIAWVESDGSHYQVRVKRFDGQNFNSLGGSLNVDPTADAGSPSIADVGGVPYVTWSEFDAQFHSKVYVKRFDGTNWVLVGKPLSIDPAKSAFSPSLASIGGFPHVGWIDSVGGTTARAAREDPPVCTGSSVSVPHAGSAAVSLSCNEGTRSVVGGPGNGTLSGLDPVGGGATYTPTPSFAGADSFSFKSNDGAFDSNVATVSLSVADAGGGALPKIAKLSKLGESNSTFVVDKGSTPTTGRTSVRRRRPKGTTFSFSLDQPAKVKVAISRELAGRKVGKKCKPPTRALRRKRRCTRLQGVGTLTRGAHTGTNRIKFTGRIGRRALKPGRYQAAFTATDAAGTSKPSVLRFTIVAR